MKINFPTINNSSLQYLQIFLVDGTFAGVCARVDCVEKKFDDLFMLTFFILTHSTLNSSQALWPHNSWKLKAHFHILHIVRISKSLFPFPFPSFPFSYIELEHHTTCNPKYPDELPWFCSLSVFNVIWDLCIYYVHSFTTDKVQLPGIHILVSSARSTRVVR